MFKPRVTKGPKLNLRQRIVVIAMDVLLLAELTFSIYLGHQDPEYMAAIFLKVFIPMLIATVVVARILIKRFHRDKLHVGDEQTGQGHVAWCESREP